MNISKTIAVISLFSSSCNNTTQNTAGNIDSTATNAISLPSKKAFQQTIDGKAVDLYILKNKNNIQAAITNYGGRLVSLMVPDKNNKMTDVVVGFKSLSD